jgi:hypothetical protein
MPDLGWDTGLKTGAYSDFTLEADRWATPIARADDGETNPPRT